MVWIWLGFLAFILLLLALDLGVFHRKAHVVKVKEALTWSVVWAALAARGRSPPFQATAGPTRRGLIAQGFPPCGVGSDRLGRQELPIRNDRASGVAPPLRP